MNKLDELASFKDLAKLCAVGKTTFYKIAKLYKIKPVIRCRLYSVPSMKKAVAAYKAANKKPVVKKCKKK